MVDKSPFIVYQEWTEAQVREAFEEFKYQMYNGAGSDELKAGIRCFDFMIRRSDLSQILIDYIHYSCQEAEMRIVMMDELDAINRTRGENIDRAITSIEHMKRVLDGITRQMRDGVSYSYENIERYLQNRRNSQL